MKFLCKPKLVKDSIVIDVSHIPPDEIEKFISQFPSGMLAQVEFKSVMSKAMTRSYEQLKLWWDIVNTILTHHGVELSPDNKTAYSEYLKSRYLPIREVIINGIHMPLPSSISDRANWSTKEFSEIITAILDDYRREGVLFNVDLKSYNIKDLK